MQAQHDSVRQSAGEDFSRLKFGVLNFALPHLSSTRDHEDLILDLVEGVVQAEALGFSRFWLGEHHTFASPFGESPELLLPVLAGTTKTIQVGIGALLLGYYSPIKVANQFRLLETLFPGRIDLGIGRAGVDNVSSHHALLDGREGLPPGPFPQELYARKCADLVSFLRMEIASDHPFFGLAFNPLVERVCRAWICGQKTAGQMAARLGVGLSVSLFHGVEAVSSEIISDYRASFQPTQDAPSPVAMLAICGACCDCEYRGRSLQEEWLERVNGAYRPTIVGTPEQWRAQLAQLVEQHRPDEVMILDICEDPEERQRSLELLSETLGIRPNESHAVSTQADSPSTG
jgi:luciferase family oxidoreductase group 1